MALSPGTRLGLYEIVDALGTGGMGEVYRARDTKLGRTVAVKVLPEAFAFDPERIARFEREAKVLASLNHPHIAALFGMEQSFAAASTRIQRSAGRRSAISERRSNRLPPRRIPNRRRPPWSRRPSRSGSDWFRSRRRRSSRRPSPARSDGT